MASHGDTGTASAAPTTAAGVEEDDLDLLTMMASLEKASKPTAHRSDGVSSTATTAHSSGISSAAQMLETLATVMSTTAASRTVRATRPRISSTAATVMTSSLARHPALMLHLPRSEQVQTWKDAVATSMAYTMDDEAGEDDDDDSGGGDRTPAERQQHGAAATSGIGVADQTVLSIAGNEGIRNAFLFAQHVSDELERERLQAVFQGATPSELLCAMEMHVQQAHGVDAAKGVAYPGDAGAIPQRMWLHCLFGPLMSLDVLNWIASEGPSSATAHVAALASDRQHLAEVRLPLTSAALARAVERIGRHPYDANAWLFVLEACMDVPLSECRSAWLFASYLFPTAGPLVLAYAKKELEHADDLMQSLAATSNSSTTAGVGASTSSSVHHLGQQPQQQQFREGDDEEDAKKLYRARMRLLNVFYRHLPRCSSWQLYDLFLTFLQTHVVTDARSIDQVYRLALEQHVGQCVDSTPLWIRYLEWRANKISAIPEKLKFVRGMFHRILRTPLDGLAEVRERYDAFESAEVRGGRVRLEDELERAMTRAKSFAAERMHSMDRLLHQRIVPASERMASAGGPTSASWVYLPRPFVPRPEDDATRFRTRCHVEHQQPAGSGAYLEEDDCTEAQQLWLLMHRILLTELESNLSAAQSEEGHFRRVAFVLRLRTQLFPHESFCWLELSNVMVHGLPRQRVRSDFGPTGLVGSAAPAYLGPHCATMAAEVLREALYLLPQHVHITVALAELIRMRLGTPRVGERLFKDAIAAHRRRVVHQIFPMLDALQAAAQKLMDASGGTPGGTTTTQTAGAAHTQRAHQQRYAQLHATLLTVLEHVMVLAGNWLVFARAAYPRNAATQTRLVAQYLLHELEILSMVMSAVRRLSRLATVLQCTSAFVPGSFLDAFNAFCSHWINVELHQLHSPDAALLVLQGWMEQLRGMVLSTRRQGWTLTDCGVDERFFVRAMDIGRSTAKRSEQVVGAAAPMPSGDDAAGKGHPSAPTAAPTVAASRRRVYEVLSIVERLVDVLPTIAAHQEGTDNEAKAVDLAFQCVQHRCWVSSLCQQLDPIGNVVLQAFPKLSVWHPACTDSITPAVVASTATDEEGGGTIAADATNGGPPSRTTTTAFEQLRARHCAYWAHGTEGILTGSAETVRTLWGSAPIRMLATEEFASSSRSARETEWCAAERCAGAVDGGDAGARGVVDDDIDAVHPDVTQWQILPPRPPQVRGGRGGRRGMGGGRGAHKVVEQRHGGPDALAHDDGDEGHSDNDDKELPRVLVWGAGGGDGGAGDPGQQLVSIDGALMSMSVAMEKRARQTLGRRMAVQVASHRGNVSAAEGLGFWLDMAETDRKLFLLAQQQQEQAAAAHQHAADERIEPPRSSHRAEGQAGPRHHFRRPETTEDVLTAFYARSRPSTLALAANRSDDALLLEATPHGHAHVTHSAAPSAALRGQCAMEALLSHVLPPRYAFGPTFDGKRVNVDWLVQRLQTTDTLVRPTAVPSTVV